ncbi:MAG: acetate/propionate family kinase [Acidobacteriaceae bacterium]
MNVLVLNSGSSSQKACLYNFTGTPPNDPAACLWEAKVEWNAERTAVVQRISGGAPQITNLHAISRPKAIEHLLSTIWNDRSPVLHSHSEIDAVGHRIVHGGPKYEEPVLISPEVKSEIAKAAAFAPLHNRAELGGIEIVDKMIGSVPQVAVFDTSFHSRMPPEAVIYPGPYEWFERGIRRYGFHGISHQYCAQRTAELLPQTGAPLRIVCCHLGNGCSLAAIRNGQSIDTTMGFTPLEGLMMGTRSGSVDPGILTYLMRSKDINAEKMDDLLNHRSGLLGISGISGDMREILAAVRRRNERAKLAFDIYVHRLQTGIAAMTASLGGLDALVFTAGVGENSPEVRSATCAKLRFLGITLDERKNMEVTPDQNIAAVGSAVRVLVVRTQEDWAIARECWKLMRASGRVG